jgi:hypothetical protein
MNTAPVTPAFGLILGPSEKNWYAKSSDYPCNCHVPIGIRRREKHPSVSKTVNQFTEKEFGEHE